MSLFTKATCKVIKRPVDLALTAATIKEIFKGLDLPIGAVIPGVFNGKWGGNGPLIESVDPSTNKITAKIQSVKDSINGMELNWLEIFILGEFG